jgi:hypothetical protein
MTSPNATLVTFVSAVISPKARSLDTETIGKSSIAVFVSAENRLFDGLRSTKLCTFLLSKTLRASFSGVTGGFEAVSGAFEGGRRGSKRDQPNINYLKSFKPTPLSPHFSTRPIRARANA